MFACALSLPNGFSDLIFFSAFLSTKFAFFLFTQVEYQRRGFFLKGMMMTRGEKKKEVTICLLLCCLDKWSCYFH